jgi:hypothetical protein
MQEKKIKYKLVNLKKKKKSDEVRSTHLEVVRRDLWLTIRKPRMTDLAICVLVCWQITKSSFKSNLMGNSVYNEDERGVTLTQSWVVGWKTAHDSLFSVCYNELPGTRKFIKNRHFLGLCFWRLGSLRAWHWMASDEGLRASSQQASHDEPKQASQFRPLLFLKSHQCHHIEPHPHCVI